MLSSVAGQLPEGGYHPDGRNFVPLYCQAHAKKTLCEGHRVVHGLGHVYKEIDFIAEGHVSDQCFR
jgi:hypothetical protein